MKKVALITGASGGIGEALAYEAVKRGYNVSLMARNEGNLQKVAQNCENAGAEVCMLTGDVSLRADCEKFVSESIKKFGQINVLINNAGMSMRAIFADTDPEVLEKVMNTNFWGTVYCTHSAMESLLKVKGSVVGVSSIAGFKGLPARTGYSASKFAMNGFLESLRCENLKTGLHVLTACPGYTASNIRNTALNAEGKMQADSPLEETKLMQANEVAIQIWNAIAKRKNYMILTLQGKMVVWINKLFPKLADRLVYNFVRKEKNSPFQ